jgi:hypothetical protein
MLVAFGLTVYINGAVWDYWGSMGYSNRRFTEMSAPLGLGMALLLGAIFRYAERHPRAVAGALLSVVVGAFSAWNVAAMTGVGSGRIANWREARSDLIWEQVFHELARGTYEAVGNPLAWPASLPFALRFDTHPMRYDAMRGMTLFYGEYHDASPRHGETSAYFTGGSLHALYAAEGFADEPETMNGRKGLRVTGERARLLLPIFMDGVGAVRLRYRRVEPGDGRVRLEWDGVELDDRDVDGRWRLQTFPVPEGVAHAGVNDVELFVTGGPILIASLDLVAAPPRPTREPAADSDAEHTGSAEVAPDDTPGDAPDGRGAAAEQPPAR